MGNCISTTEAERHIGFIVFEVPAKPAKCTYRNFNVLNSYFLNSEIHLLRIAKFALGVRYLGTAFLLTSLLVS